MIPEVFFELTLIFALTLVICGIIKMLKQPLIIGYILSGIIAGPFFLKLTTSIDTLSIFANMGIAFLLFLVGLNLNPKTIKEIGKISIITGVGQVLFTSILGFVICQLIGFSVMESIYISIALTFSSTIIIMKLLSDKKDLETLYGKISIGFLIVQDFIVIFILMFLTQNLEVINLGELLIYSVAKGIGIFAVLGIIAWWAVPKITNFIAKSQEYLLLFSIGWCLIIASIFHFLNFSIEAGALIAGMMLSFSPYHYEISSRVRPLRDFLIVLFFILLGSQMVFGNIIDQLPTIIILSILILVGNPLIVIILMGLFGYTKRNSFKAGLTVAQISEFSLILITVGIKLGHLTLDILSLVTIVGIITITGSTYLIIYSDKIYPYLSNILSIFERKGKKIDEHKYQKKNSYNIILFGYNRIGFDVLKTLKKITDRVLVVDYDPNVILQVYKEGVDCRYGDANDVELIQELNINDARLVISTIPDFETNMILLRQIQVDKKKTIFLPVATQHEDAIELYKAGATYVIMPYFLGGTKVSSMIEDFKFNSKKFTKEKKEHMKYLKKRQKECQGPEFKN